MLTTLSTFSALQPATALSVGYLFLAMVWMLAAVLGWRAVVFSTMPTVVMLFAMSTLMLKFCMQLRCAGGSLLPCDCDSAYMPGN